MNAVATVVASLLGAGVVSALVSWLVARRESSDRQAALALEREMWETQHQDEVRQRRAARQTPQFQLLHDAVKMPTYRGQDNGEDIEALYDWLGHVKGIMAPLVLNGDHPVGQRWRDVQRAADEYASAMSQPGPERASAMLRLIQARNAMQSQILLSIKELHG